MTSLKLTTTSFLIHYRIFISDNIQFLSINLDQKHAKPNTGKIFNANNFLITKFLNLNGNIVKSLFFTKKRLISDNNFQNCYWFQKDALCWALSHIPSFYDIAHLWTIDCVLFLDIHMQICVPPNIYLFCGLVLIFLCGLLSLSRNTDYS